MTTVAGRVPPHDLDAEAAVLSAILLAREALDRVLEILKPEHFYADANGRIYEAALDLARANVPIDIVSVAGWLRDRERLAAVGGAPYLAQLADATPAVAHVEAHARIVVDKWRLRRLIATYQKAAAEGYGDLGVDVATWAEKNLTELRALGDLAASRAPLVPPAQAIAELVASWARPAPFAPTGLSGLDRMLAGGLRAGNVIGLAGAAKAGKSALAGQILYDAVSPDILGIYASVEMDRSEVWARFVTREVFRLALAEGAGRGPRGPVASFGEVFHGQAYRHGQRAGARPEDVALLARIEEATARAAARPNLYVEHLAPGSTPHDLRALVRSARRAWAASRPPRAHRPLCVLVIDPIQRLFAGPSGALAGAALDRINGDEISRMGQVAQQLKVLADEEAVAIVFPSDGTKGGAGSGPQPVTDLRGNYQLNHLATTILALHSRRPADPTDPTSAALALAEATGDKKDAAAGADAILDAMPPWWVRWAQAEEGGRLGPRPVLLDCSGNRQGDAADHLLGFVRGACAFVEGEGRGG